MLFNIHALRTHGNKRTSVKRNRFRADQIQRIGLFGNRVYRLQTYVIHKHLPAARKRFIRRKPRDTELNRSGVLRREIIFKRIVSNVIFFIQIAVIRTEALTAHQLPVVVTVRIHCVVT